MTINKTTAPTSDSFKAKRKTRRAKNRNKATTTKAISPVMMTKII